MAKAKAYTMPETLHNDPDAMRDALAQRIKAQAIRLRDEEVSKRDQWIAIGADLLMARESTLSKNDFGIWIEQSGIKELPGLTTASARSDVIWLAEFPDKVAKIDPEIAAPRYIRQKWRTLFASSCMIEADALLVLDAVEVPDIEAAAEGVATVTGSTQKEAFDEIKRIVEAELSDGGEDLEASVAKAIPKLKKALQAAADAGITHEMLCINAGAVWGGFFSWGAQPAAEDASAHLKAAVVLAKDGGASFKDWLSAAGEAWNG